MHERYDAELTRQPGTSPRVHRRLGIIGGGQLAKMTALAGLQLGLDVVVLERNNHSPAATLAAHAVVGDWDQLDSLAALARQVDVVTLENEFVDVAALEGLEQLGVPLRPSAAVLRLVQDKLAQKRALLAAGLPVPAFRDAPTRQSVLAAGREFGWPLLLKARRHAYDGKGNVLVRSRDELPRAWEHLDGDRRALYVEAHVPFERELAIIITRSLEGQTACYPVVESVQRQHICHEVLAPAELDAGTAAAVTAHAQRVGEVTGLVGSYGVECFLLRSGEVLLNELAPRVHNSGHYSIEGCTCSQFENHVRAVLGWPLGAPTLRAPAAAMVNVLGERLTPATLPGLPAALAVPGAQVHVYGKVMSGPGRKMGHVTALGATTAEALATARRAAELLRVGDSE